MARRADIDYVKHTYSIRALVREVQEDLYGANAVGLVQPDADYDQKTRCPVHEDGNPSAKVYIASNSVYCWVCGTTWDPPGLLAVSRGISLNAAVRILLGRLGVEMPEEDGSRKVRTDALARLRDHLSTEVTEAEANAWLDQVYAWALDNEGEYPQLDEVMDACSWATGLAPGDAILAVRNVIAWARAISPALPAPPAEGELERAILGV